MKNHKFSFKKLLAIRAQKRRCSEGNSNKSGTSSEIHKILNNLGRIGVQEVDSTPSRLAGGPAHSSEVGEKFITLYFLVFNT